jgi:hypothetical protein
VFDELRGDVVVPGAPVFVLLDAADYGFGIRICLLRKRDNFIGLRLCPLLLTYLRRISRNRRQSLEESFQTGASKVLNLLHHFLFFPFLDEAVLALEYFPDSIVGYFARFV